jgi:hypothetical protein
MRFYCRGLVSAIPGLNYTPTGYMMVGYGHYATGATPPTVAARRTVDQAGHTVPHSLLIPTESPPDQDEQKERHDHPCPSR